MKSLYLNLIIIFLITPAFAQQITKTDDALLLEYYQTQRYADAADYLKKTFPEPVKDIKVLSRLAYTSQMANKLADAEGYYQRAYNLDTTNQNALFNMGNINLRRGNYLKAEIYYKRITAKDTTNFAVYNQLAEIAEKKNDTAAAIHYLKKANILNPYAIDVASELSDFYTQLKLFGLSLQVLNKAAENDPDNVTILLSMLKLTYVEKKWAETVIAANRLINLGVVADDVLNKLGIAYFNLNSYTCGAETFAGISGLGQNEYTFYYAALCYKGLKDEKNAIIFLTKSIEQGISPNIATYYGEIADSESKLTSYRKSAKAYIKGLQFSQNSTIYYLLANLYDTRLKDKKNALKYYKKYLASRPPAKQQTYIVFSKIRVEQLKN